MIATIRRHVSDMTIIGVDDQTEPGKKYYMIERGQWCRLRQVVGLGEEPMPGWAKEHFAARPWHRRTMMRSLGPEVLAVAHTRIERKWCAYIGRVFSEDYTEDFGHILAEGTKLDPDLAFQLFPEFLGVPYAL